MSTRRKQLKPKAIKDGEASEECDENCDRSIDEQNGKRIKLELNGNADANDFESVSSGSRPTSTSIINSTSYAATDFCNMHCIFCNKPFSDVTALQNHIITDHMNMKIFQKGAENSSANANGDIASSLVCQQCDAKFTNFVNFGQHMRIHLKNDGDAKCHLCSSTFGNSQARFNHIVEHFTGNVIRLICKECPMLTFLNGHQMRQHHLENHLEILYRCAICQKIFNTQNRFQQHLNVHNEEIMQYQCAACNTLFESNDLLAIHVQLIHDRPINHISNVGDSGDQITPISIDRNLSSISSATDNRSVKCLVCDIKFENDEELDSHRLYCHCKIPRSDRCAECQEKIHNISQFIDHTRKHMSEQTTACIVCRQALRNEAQIESHAKFHMHMQERNDDMITGQIAEISEHETDWRCIICLQSFTSEERLRSHSFEHSSLGECAYCNQNFGQDLQRLLNHLDSHHNYTKTALHCQNCPKSFRFISDLQNHKCIGQDATNPMLHATENFFRTFSESYTPIFQQSLPRISYQCPLCPKIFASESALQGHSHIHSTRAYRCDLCTLSFSSNTRLETHRRKHFTEKNFTCQICDKKFQSRSDLTCHVKIHGGNLKNSISNQQPAEI